MTEHKYTDEEVIKALECCNDNFQKGCDDCIFNGASYDDEPSCVDKLNEATRALINRQKAEIAFWMDAAANAKKEAVKEFAEKVKEKAYVNKPYGVGKSVDECDIDDLVKEFTEEKT